MGRKEDIEAVITPALTSLGLYLEDINITAAGRRSLITVMIDGDKHLSLNEVTVATKAITEIVENISSLGSTPFTLEVTSPGVDRPLTKVRHWRKNIDRLVKVIKLDGSQLNGRIKAVSDNYAVIAGIEVKFSDIKRANLEIEFKSVKK
jgi:ribosome maturation factor RimP